MYNGFVKLRRGLEEHLEAGKISYLEAGLYIRLMMKANYTTGVVYVTTSELASCGTSIHQVRHALDRLEDKKYIRTWRNRGRRSRFAVAINKHERVNVAAKCSEYLSAFKSNSPEELCWESGEVAANSSQCGGEVVSMSPRTRPEESYMLVSEVTENTEDTSSLEVRSKEVKNLEEEKEEMSIRKQLTNIARTKLKTRIPPDDRSWPEISSVAEAYGVPAVVDAFELFCGQHQGEQLAYPLSKFIRVVDGLVDGSTASSDTSSQHLATALALQANDERIVFGQKHVSTLARLLTEHTPEQIKDAFRIFLPTLENDSFLIKNAAKTFVETAPQLIAIQAKRRQDALNMEQVKATEMARGRAEVEGQLADAEKRRLEEESFVDPLLDAI